MHPQQERPELPHQPPEQPEPEPPEKPKPDPEPNWTDYPALRVVTNLGNVLSDIESHMPAGHIYRSSDKITWTHETSHGLASNIRQKNSRAGYCAYVDGKPVFKSADGINGFYVLNDRSVVLKEPDSTLTAVANWVPSELRGDVYNLYLVQQRRYWNSEPLYTLDEWVAYSNGSATRADLKITSRGETVQYMMEFTVYAISMAAATKTQDEDIKSFLMWHSKRVMDLYKQNQEFSAYSGAESYWNKAKNNSKLKEFCYEYFGKDWSQQNLGF